LQQETQRHTGGRAQSSEPGSNKAGKAGADQGVPKSEAIQSSLMAGEITAGVGVQPEIPAQVGLQAVQNEEMTEVIPEASPASSLKMVKTEYSAIQFAGEEVAEQLVPRFHAATANTQYLQQANNLPETVAVPISTAVNTAITDSHGNPALAEALLAGQSEENSVSQTGTNISKEAGQTSKQSASFSSVVISNSAEAQNSKKSQVQTVDNRNQTTRELAEFENRKLTGQKTMAAQTASSPEQNSVGRESQQDSSFQSNRGETPMFRFSELNSPGMSKTETSAPQVDSQDVLNQIVRKAELMLRQNSSQMKIELQPEFLGRLTIKVIVEEGAVTARFITDNHQVKQMLEANLGILRQTLENHGMRVERAEVNVQLNNGGLFDGSESQSEWNWEHRYQPNPTGSSLKDSGIYDIPEYLQEDHGIVEQYGIAANGSLNFLV
jgi:flagellar hook-length control protein FliK